MTAEDIELAIAEQWNWRQNIIVPNVTWGMGFSHELDLLIVTKAGYGIEVEIKVDKSDLKRDKLKKCEHGGDKIKAVYFAVPREFGDISEHISPEYGIIHVTDDEDVPSWRRTQIIRQATYNKGCRPFTQEEQFTLCRLGCMRIWGLKAKIRERRRGNE